MDTNGSCALAKVLQHACRLLVALGVLGQAAVACAQQGFASSGGVIQTAAIARNYAPVTPPAPVPQQAPAPQLSVSPYSMTSYANSAANTKASWVSNSAWQSSAGSVYGGVDYLLIRTHFSEAIAFVKVSDSLSNGLPQQSVTSQEINFPYNSAFRTFVGYQISPRAALQLTYFHLGTSAKVDGTPGAGQTIVDAYGDQAKAGQTMATNSSVNLNVFDLDYAGRFAVGRQFVLRPAAGVRWATVRQHNDSSVIDPVAGTLGVGTFNTRFTGFGPHFSLLSQTYFRPNSPFSFIARGAGSLLVGPLNNNSGLTITGVAGGDQSTHRILTVPVIEAELGGAWQPTENLMFSAGWLWQAWFDMGVSGGTTYNGKFAEADSASIMSFDGLFLRGMWRY